MYSRVPLDRLISNKKEEIEELQNQIKEYEKIIYSADNADDVSDEVFSEISKCKMKVQMIDTTITNVNKQIKILEDLEKNIKKLEKTHSDIFKAAYSLLNRKF